MLRIHLLTQNNEKTISKALESLLPLESEIVVGDMGSQDETPKLCKLCGVKVMQIGKTTDYSAARNRLLGPEMNFYLHPWEVLADGFDSIREASGEAYQVRIFRNNVVTQEIRLWRDLEFVNPVYETIKHPRPDMLQAAIYSKTPPTNPEILPLVRQWRETTGSIEPYYYEAIALLSSSRFNEFVPMAEHYLSLDASSLSATVLRSHLAQIQLHLGNGSKAVRNVLACLAIQPLMAEFWCLLGDIFYRQQKYLKAKAFYENGIILGSRRKNDDWPIELSKYKEYPQQMIDNIDKIVSESKTHALDH